MRDNYIILIYIIYNANLNYYSQTFTILTIITIFIDIIILRFVLINIYYHDFNFFSHCYQDNKLRNVDLYRNAFIQLRF